MTRTHSASVVERTWLDARYCCFRPAALKIVDGSSDDDVKIAHFPNFLRRNVQVQNFYQRYGTSLFFVWQFRGSHIPPVNSLSFSQRLFGNLRSFQLYNVPVDEREVLWGKPYSGHTLKRSKFAKYQAENRTGHNKGRRSKFTFEI